jgi:erythromycin esterase-like protein
MKVNPSLAGSIERALHEVGHARCVVPLHGSPAADAARAALAEPLLERAIGVIYRPRTERMSHYFRARVGAQFDVLYHYDESSAVRPLEQTGRGTGGEPPETFPTAL